MITALLMMIVGWCLFYGRISTIVLLICCASWGLLIGISRKHKHTQFIANDVYAQTSQLNKVNPMLKFLSVVILMILGIVSKSPLVGGLLVLLMMGLTIVGGGLPWHIYVHLLLLPISFILISGLALLFEVSQTAIGVINIPLGSWWITISHHAQVQTMLIISRALGAVSCLYFLSLSTPMTELIGVLKRLRCPDIIVELMYLIYRYIFIVLSMYYAMRTAAKSRMGYVNYHANIRTTGNLYSNLISRSYRYAAKNFDAMESRCYSNEIRFLEREKPVKAQHMIIAIAMISGILIVFILA